MQKKNKKKEAAAADPQTATSHNNNTIIKDSPPKIKEWRSDALDASNFERPAYLIDHLLFDGVTLLVGGTKVGKSILVEQMAHAIATGTPLWGNSVKTGTVLYLNMESDPSNAKNRRSAMGLDATEKLYYVFEKVLNLTNLDAYLGQFKEKHPDLVLVIIDTLHRIRGIHSTTQEYSYAQAVNDIDVLQNIALKQDLSFIAVHHPAKNSNDPLGSQGIFGTVSSKLTLTRPEELAFGQLTVIPRFHPEWTLPLKFVQNPLMWVLDKENGGSENLPVFVSYILKFLAECESHQFEGTCNALWLKANLANLCKNPQTLSRSLNDYKAVFKTNNVTIKRGRNNGRRIICLKWHDF